MIHVVASIHVKEGRRPAFLEILKSNVPAVLDERGCVAYAPAVDVAAGLPPQELDDAVVTIIEQWRSLEDLRAHLSAPHMTAYREKVKDMVARVSLKVLTDA